ncbi:hypothetical protein PYCCODRAFT_1436288, partial [Trametes coccinea BRFM310]
MAEIAGVTHECTSLMALRNLSLCMHDRNTKPVWNGAGLGVSHMFGLVHFSCLIPPARWNANAAIRYAAAPKSRVEDGKSMERKATVRLEEAGYPVPLIQLTATRDTHPRNALPTTAWWMTA